MSEIKENNKIVSRSYLVSGKVLVSKLGLKGKFQEIVLYEGLSPDDIIQDNEKEIYEVVTHE